MNLQQLRYICEVARCDLKVARAAEALHTSQPGISTQIRLLEEELGVEIFSRQRNRLVGVTPGGAQIIERAQRILLEIGEIRQVGRLHAAQESGTLVIAASHTQARFRLPGVLRRFLDRCPNVHIVIRPESGRSIQDALMAGAADIGILSLPASEARSDLVALPFQSYRRLLLVCVDHPLLAVSRPTFADLARYPLVMYEPSQTGMAVLRTLEQLGLKPPSVVQATNADVVKAYVEHRLGVAILPDLVFDAARDAGLRGIDVSHLFPVSTTSVMLNRKHYLPAYAYTFIETLAPDLGRAEVQRHLLAAAGGR